MQNNLEELQKVIEQRIKRRLKKKRPKMVVSGKSILAIQKIIRKKTGR